VGEAGKFKHFWGFCVPWKGHKEQGQGNVGGTIQRPTSGKHLFDANDVKTDVQQPLSYVLRKGVYWEVANYCLDRLVGFGLKREVG
jgi:hypothetical protein